MRIETFTPQVIGPACYEFALYGEILDHDQRDAADAKCLEEEIHNPVSIIRKYLTEEYIKIAFPLVEDLDSHLFLCAGMRKHPSGKMLPPDHWWIRTNTYIYDMAPGIPLRRVPYRPNVNNCPANYLLRPLTMADLQNDQIFIGELPVRLPIAHPNDCRRTAIDPNAAWGFPVDNNGFWAILPA